MYRVGKARKRFLARPGNRREPASCAGGRENSLALQAPNVSRLCRKCEGSKLMEWRVAVNDVEVLSSKGAVGGGKEKERAAGAAWQQAVAGEEKADGHVLCAPLTKDHPLS
jgi:hypothetical protein